MTVLVSGDASARPVRFASPALEFAHYFACSAVALGIDLGLFAVLLHLGAAWAIAAALGFLAGLVTIYVLSVRIVFARRRVPDRRIEFAVFASIGLLGLALTEGLLWLFIEGMGIGAVAAKLLAAGGVFISNFTLRKLVLFVAPAKPFGGRRS